MTGEVEAKLLDHYKQVRKRLRGEPPAPERAPEPPPPPPEPPPPPRTTLSFIERRASRRRALHDACLTVIEAHTRIPAKYITAHKRKKEYVEARSKLCWIASKCDDELSARQIGAWLGKRDHTTVWWSLDRIRRAREIDGDLVLVLDELEHQVRRILQEHEE